VASNQTVLFEDDMAHCGCSSIAIND